MASFENDAAGNWFLLVEEGRDPGAVIASVIDDVAGAAESLEIDACSRRSLPRCSARVAPVSCRIVWQTTCPGGCRRILTGRTPTRSSSRPTPSPACARRASCATSETTPKTFLSRWPKWTSSYRDWDGPAPGAHPLLDQVQRKASGHLSLSGLRIPWPMGRGKPSVDSADRPAFRKQTLSAARWQCESCRASEPRVRDSRIGRRASVIRARRLRRGGTRARRRGRRVNGWEPTEGRIIAGRRLVSGVGIGAGAAGAVPLIPFTSLRGLFGDCVASGGCGLRSSIAIRCAPRPGLFGETG